METANIKLSIQEMDFTMQVLNEIPVKGIQNQLLLTSIAAKLQKAIQDSQKPLVNISPEQIKQAEEIMRQVKEKQRPPEPEMKIEKQG